MANKFAYDKNYYERRYSASIEGNAARQLEEEYEEEYYSDEELYDEEYEEADFGIEPEYEYETEAETEQKVKIKRKYNFNAIAVMFMMISVVGLMYASFGFLAARSSISQATKALATAKSELADAEAINASLRNQLDVDVDRNYIYTVAVEKLNMTYPTNGQTVFYERPDEGYVRQFQSIPTAKN